MSDGPQLLVRLSGLKATAGASFDTDLALLAGTHLVMLDERMSTARSIARIICGLQSPHEGVCRIGRSQVDPLLPPSKRRVGYVPNPPVVLRGMSLRTFLRLTAPAHGMSSLEASRMTGQVMDWCSLSTHSDKTLESLGRTGLYVSGFAAALVHHPSILVLEGPVPEEVQQLLPSLAEAGKTVISTAVSVSGIPRTADRVALCDEHGIRLTKTTTEIFEASGKLSALEVSFSPSLRRELLEAVPGLLRITSRSSGFRLGLSSLETALIAITNIARANARRIVELSTAPPDVDHLISYFDYLDMPEAGGELFGRGSGAT